jgi:hypothetical protein
MTEAHNAFAGNGAVVLDIGGDIGALVVTMPPGLDGVEIEIRPVGAAPDHDHDHGHDHDRGQGHDHSDGHAHGDSRHPHVAVVARPSGQSGQRRLPSLVYPELVEGSYELYEKLGGPVRLRATVRGGEVTEATWPDAEPSS